MIDVFSIVQRTSAQQAVHPDYKGPLPSQRGEEVLATVGRAFRQQDGSYLIQLTAFPLNGQLLLRPSSDTRRQSATYQADAR